MSRIPLSVPSISGNEMKYLKECIDSEWVSSAGSFVGHFESKISEYTGSKYAIAVVNGTSALHLSLMISGVGRNDEVIIPTVTFIAPVNAIKYCGASPIFMDSDEFFNIDVEKTIEFLTNETITKNGYTYNKITNKRIAAIIPVHVWGNAVDIEQLVGICKEKNIEIIEDASESLGTRYNSKKLKGKHTGTIGSFGCISFNGNKIITTGGGGMILTNKQKFAEKAIYFSTQAKDDPRRYIHNNVGYNYRITNIQAALGVGQLEQLEKFINLKKSIRQSYLSHFKNISGVTLSPSPNYANNNYWLNVIHINEEKYGRSINDLNEKFEANNIEVRPVWMLNHLQKPFKHYQSYKIENAIKQIKNSLCIPSSTKLSNEDIEKIAWVMK